MNFIKRKTKYSNLFILMLAAFFMLAFFIKGNQGKPLAYQIQKDTNVGGPFESSNSTSRYALTEAIVEHHTFFLTKEEARFASPDLVYHNGKFLSIFMPGISFIGTPFYLLGNKFGLPQLFTYFSVTLFAFIDIFLIARIVYKLGGNLYASFLAGFLFLFGTNALSYSLFYTQHATSVMFLLLCFLTAMDERTVVKNVLFGIFAGISLLLDIPNVILLVPLGLYIVSKHFTANTEDTKIQFSFNTKIIAILFGLLPFLCVTAWYNFQTTGSYTKLGQSIGRTDYQRINEKTKSTPKHVASSQVLPFLPRNQIGGIYTLVLSDERSWLFYSPIVLLGIFGIRSLYKEKKKTGLTNVIVGTILINILLYSMFDDPWGGWAFGPRYLIPGAAMLCIGLGIAIQKYKRNIWFVILFAVTAVYSLTINTIGALTTSAIPPKVEAIHFIQPIPYTYLYNINLLKENRMSSLIYNVVFSHLQGWIYSLTLAAILLLITLCLYYLALVTKEDTTK